MVGATLSNLLSMGVGYKSDMNGMTNQEYCTHESALIYNGQTKQLFSFNNVPVYLRTDGLTLNTRKEAATHEMGHAIGYGGHSSFSSNGAMWPSTNGIISPHDDEKAHLRQVKY